LKILGFKLEGSLRWGEKIPCKKQGIYIVLTPNKKATNLIFNRGAINLWIKKVANMEVGTEKPTFENLSTELKRFWFNNEIILYVGQTSQPIRTRVNQYYKTEIGERKPHSGGYWIKTLAFLNDCLVFWKACDHPKEIETKILTFFHHQFSDKNISKENLIIPFANLEIHLQNKNQKIRKNHILKKARI